MQMHRVRWIASARRNHNGHDPIRHGNFLRHLSFKLIATSTPTVYIFPYQIYIKDKLGRGALFDQDFARTGPILNRGKKKELLLDDAGGNALFKATSSLGNTPLGGAKGKRSERERDKDVLSRNSVTKAGRPSQSNIKGDRKAKSKPKQKIAQLSTSGDGIINKFKDTGSNKKREAGATSNGSNPVDSAKEGSGATNIAKLQELDPIELHEGNDFGDTQDLNSLFDGLPENDLGEILLDDMPLQIPMDDLSTIL